MSINTTVSTQGTTYLNKAYYDRKLLETAKARLVHVYRLAATEFAPPLVSFDLLCTKGVCVRALAHDLGQQLGCGASLESLRRTKVAKFSVDDAIGLMDLLKLDAIGFKNRVIPMAGALAG